MATGSKMFAAWLPGHDARWVIATVLVVAGLLWTKSDGLGNRINDMNDRMNAMNGHMDAMNDRMDAMNDRMDDLRDDVASQIAELRVDLRRIDDRLRAVEIAVQPGAPSPGE